MAHANASAFDLKLGPKQRLTQFPLYRRAIDDASGDERISVIENFSPFLTINPSRSIKIYIEVRIIGRACEREVTGRYDVELVEQNLSGFDCRNAEAEAVGRIFICVSLYVNTSDVKTLCRSLSNIPYLEPEPIGPVRLFDGSYSGSTDPRATGISGVASLAARVQEQSDCQDTQHARSNEQSQGVISKLLSCYSKALVQQNFLLLFAPFFLGCIFAGRGGWRLYESTGAGLLWFGAGVLLACLTFALVASL